MTRVTYIHMDPRHGSYKCERCDQYVQTVYQRLPKTTYVCEKHLTADERFFVKLAQREPAVHDLLNAAGPA